MPQLNSSNSKRPFENANISNPVWLTLNDKQQKKKGGKTFSTTLIGVDTCVVTVLQCGTLRQVTPPLYCTFSLDPGEHNTRACSGRKKGVWATGPLQMWLAEMSNNLEVRSWLTARVSTRRFFLASLFHSSRHGNAGRPQLARFSFLEGCAKVSHSSFSGEQGIGFRLHI